MSVRFPGTLLEHGEAELDSSYPNFGGAQQSKVLGRCLGTGSSASVSGRVNVRKVGARIPRQTARESPVKSKRGA